MLRAEPGIDALRCSSLVETQPIGGTPGQQPFLNAAAVFETRLSAEQLHDLLHDVENRLGRRRAERWSARTIDLDLLLYGDARIHTPRLTVPHPRMAFRRFVLEPAAEIAPDMRHPTLGWSVSELLQRLDAAPPYVALLGPPGSGKTALARRLAESFKGTFLADPATETQQADAAGQPSETTAPHRVQSQLAAHKQYLHARCQQLAAQPWDASTALVVSDYFVDQCLAYAELALEPGPFREYCAAHQAATAELALPKLLVLTDTPPFANSAVSALNKTRPAADAPQSSAWHDRLRAKLLELASRPRVAPVLQVGGADLDAQFAEIVAAVQATQPLTQRA